MRWLYKLEYKHGNRYIRNLMTIIVGGMVVVYLADMMGFALSGWLSLNREAVLAGQVWRLITFVFVPPAADGFWILFSLYFYYSMGQMLEFGWGGFKLNVYYLFGILGAIVAMFIAGYASNTYLNLSLFLAVATIQADTEFRLFFILPIKAKWLAIGYVVLLLVPFIRTFVQFRIILWGELAALAISLVGYLVFFGPQLLRGIREKARVAKNRRNWYNQNKRH